MDSLESDADQLRLMAVHAHPDDESSKGAATMARYVREGVQVLVCTLTGGERGDILNPAMDRPEIKADIAAVRRAEMARAREILGGEQRFLGFVDSGLPEGDPQPPLPGGSFALTPGAARGPPHAPVAGGLLRAHAGGRGGGAAGPRDPGVPAARHAHLRREGRLPA